VGVLFSESDEGDAPALAAALNAKLEETVFTGVARLDLECAARIFVLMLSFREI